MPRDLFAGLQAVLSSKIGLIEQALKQYHLDNLPYLCLTFPIMNLRPDCQKSSTSRAIDLR